MFLITLKTPPQQITEQIKILRERKGKEKETLKLISDALAFGHDFVINLFWEEALTYQHMFMNNPSDSAALGNMEQTVATAKFYIEKYRLRKWYSRLYRFMGRISDYRGKYSSSVGLYKKAVKFVKYDPEPVRELELEAFLDFALLMSGKVGMGYGRSRKLYADFDVKSSALSLKKNDYETWAIWRSGITIRTIGGLMKMNHSFDKKDAMRWLNDAKADLSGKGFLYRKSEIKQIEEKLQAE